MLNTYLDANELVFSPSVTCGNLTVVPIINKRAISQDYICLDEAIKLGVAQITETSESGTVPELNFLNTGDKPILLLDGEELVGAKQNRVLNLTLLVPAHSKVVIPVSCVEAGRWNWRSSNFASANRTLFAEARAAKMAQVSHSINYAKTYRSDQHDLWDSIAVKSQRFQVNSDTSAASEIYEKQAHDLDTLVHGIKPTDGQIGAAFIVKGKLAGMEIFGDSKGLKHLLPKLVRSYGLDAIDKAISNESRATDPNSLKAFLDNICTAPATANKAIGLGTDIRIDSASLIAAALVTENGLIHLSSFVRGYGTRHH